MINMTPEDIAITIKEIKREFFSFRNGIIADSLKKIYGTEKIIFGLNVPQLIELSKKFPQNKELGLALWNDNTSRETRLFALYVIPPAELTHEEAILMTLGIENNEQAELLAFKILRRVSEAHLLLQKLSAMNISDSKVSYCIKMFERNLDQISNQ